MSKQTEEQSSNFFIFGKGRDGNEGGGREIFPVGYPRKHSNIAHNAPDFATFDMVNGKNSKPAIYVDNFQKTWIPKDVSSPTKKNNINKDPSYNQVLIMFGKLHFGAIWNEDLAQFEQTDESDAYHFTTASEKIKYLSTFHGMNIGGYERLGEDDDRFQYDKKGNVKGIDGFGSDRMTRLKTVVEAYNNPTQANIDKGIKKILGKGLSPEEKARAKKTKFSAKPAEIEDKARQAFYKMETVKEFEKNLTVDDPRGISGGLFRIFVINDLVDKPLALTVDLEKDPLEEKINRLKEVVGIWKHWSGSFYTNPEFYATAWTDPLYKGGEEQLHFPTGLYDSLKNFTERDHKKGNPRKFDEDKREQSSRKEASVLLASWILNAPKGSWSLEKQPPETMLSRKIQEPAYGSQGQNITDKHVRMAMKFLETGKEHRWEQMKKDGRLVYEELFVTLANQTETVKLFPIEDLVEVEDNDPHYNKTLKEYEWSLNGSPYGKTMPASLFFRIGILCGWRKTEGLSCPTRSTSDASLTEASKFWKDGVSHRVKPSGLILDMENGDLDIAFLTRKTKKVGKGFFEAIIPPFSSSVMDTRETIGYVMRKAGLGKWKDPDFYHWIPKEYTFPDDEKPTPVMIREEKKDWDAEIIDLSEDELKEIFPVLKVRGKTVREAGQIPKVLLGEDGQFFPEIFTDKEGRSMEYFDAPTGKDLSSKLSNDMVRAYLEFPLMEAYAQMKGTTVTIATENAIMKRANEDRDIMLSLNKKIKVFRLENKWANECYLGCRKDEAGQVLKGEYSKDRMDQDTLRYITKDEDWWLTRTIHSIRHIFAQLWLAKSKWNFGIVADRGHWETLDTLKKHYGKVPKKVQAGFMIQVFSTDQVDEKDKFNQGLNANVSSKIAQSGVAVKIANTQYKEATEEESAPVVEKEKTEKEILEGEKGD
jgi:hypothetical protein